MQTLIQSLMLLQRLVALCLLIKVLWIPLMMINWAYVMAHEIAHGEHKDIINGAKKQIGLSTAVGIAAGGSEGAALLSNVAGNYLSNQVFTMSQEKKQPDELGFKILSESPYNVGGAAGSMAVLRNKVGEHYREGLSQVVAPNNHPKLTDRVNNNMLACTHILETT